ncbi:MAG: hypothetical protein KA247_02500 [Bacteroidetes bacterium]|nr:hypothetical protein [Bacteroidota bacterium]
MPGMVLGSDVKDSFGRTLINSGQELQSRHIEVLRAYNFVEIDIAGSDAIEQTDDGDIPPEIFADAAKDLEEHFRTADMSWDVMKQIHRSAVIRVVRVKNRKGRTA